MAPGWGGIVILAYFIRGCADASEQGSVSALSLGGGILRDEEMWDVRAKPSQPRAPSRDLGSAAATRPAAS